MGVDFVRVDLVGVDLLGVDSDLVGGHRRLWVVLVRLHFHTVATNSVKDAIIGGHFLALVHCFACGGDLRGRCQLE